MKALELTVHDEPDAADSRVVDQGLDDHNNASAPLHEVRPLACFVRDAAGAVIGGAVGRTWGACAELQQLWVQGEKGVVITEVKPDSPAAQAGLAAGDVIREVNRTPVQGMQDVEKGLSRRQDAGQVLLRVERDGAQRYIVIAAG